MNLLPRKLLKLTISVAEFLPHFSERVREALGHILGEESEKRIRIGLAKDGSGVGGEFSSLSFIDRN